MSKRYDFWTHSHTMIVEDPDRVEEVRRRRDEPMTVKQNGGDGWFGIPITRPTAIAGKGAVLQSVRLYCNTKDRDGQATASVDKAELRATSGFIEEMIPEPRQGSLIFRTSQDETKHKFRSLILWVHVNFEEVDGEIAFSDAGAHYETLPSGGQ